MDTWMIGWLSQLIVGWSWLMALLDWKIRNHNLGGFDQQCYQPLEGAAWECPLHAGSWTIGRCHVLWISHGLNQHRQVFITDDNQHLGLCSIILHNYNKYTIQVISNTLYSDNIFIVDNSYLYIYIHIIYHNIMFAIFWHYVSTEAPGKLAACPGWGGKRLGGRWDNLANKVFCIFLNGGIMNPNYLYFIRGVLLIVTNPIANDENRWIWAWILGWCGSS